MRIALIQPNLDEKYKNQRQGYDSSKRPPETGLAVLSSWISEYSRQQHYVKVLNPDNGIEEIAEEVSKYDTVGITDWFSNHDNCTELAKRAKAQNPDLTVVFGGPNASMMPKLILNNHRYIDYVVSRDGENALLGIVDKQNLQKIPNLWYRNNGIVKYTHTELTNLKKMPIWDFSNFQDLKNRLKEYLKAQNSGFDPWLISPLTLFSFRGCIKAIREGVCNYCTSSEEYGRALPPEKLWPQIRHLNEIYDAEIFYMADDIFSITLKRIKQIANAKPKEARAKIRAYGYLPDMAELKQPELKRMARDLQKIGIFNLFFGSEHYDTNVLARMNKKGIITEETSRIIKTIYDAGGIKTTIACLFGLPGETRESLEINIKALGDLLDANDCIERLYISVGMPLKGTPWYRQLESNPKLASEYEDNTGKNLTQDDSPDYSLLSRLSLKHTTSVTPREINKCLARVTDKVREKIPGYRIGGFMLDIGE